MQIAVLKSEKGHCIMLNVFNTKDGHEKER